VIIGLHLGGEISRLCRPGDIARRGGRPRWRAACNQTVISAVMPLD